MASTAQQVTWGPYFGFSRAELLTELERYKTARKQSFSRLTGANQNQQSYTFGSRADGSLDDWQAALQAALYWIDPGLYPNPPGTNTSAVTFA